jgi:YVTN family beta-propeller protein
MASKQVLAEIPVGVDPRTVAVNDGSQRAYVANRGSSSISVVDLARRQAVAEVDIGYRPYGVVIHPDGSRLYVAVQGEDRIVTLDTTTFEIVNSHPTVDRPSGLALSHDGDTLYVTHLLTGTLTVLHPTSSILFLPLILKGSPSGSTSIPNPQSPIRDPRSPISNSGPTATWFNPSSCPPMAAPPTSLTPVPTAATRT